MKLHLGAGRKHIPGWTNVDINPATSPDLLDDFAKLEKIEPETAEIIYSCHALEHVPRSQVLNVLSRWWQCLKHGGTLRLAVPDFEACCKLYLQTRSLRLVQNMIWGSQHNGDPYDFHLNGWDFASLKKDLELVGFNAVRRYDRWATDHAHIDDYSAAYWPDFDRAGMLMSLNVEATKL